MDQRTKDGLMKNNKDEHQKRQKIRIIKYETR